MGSCSSKADEPSSVPVAGQAQVDHKKVTLSDAPAPTGAPVQPKPLNQQQSHTKSGFHSDIHHDKPSMAAHLAHTNNRKMVEVYETTDGTILGRGACGVVSVVKRKDTGELYAMKQVSLDGMAGGTLSELRREIDIQRGLTHPNICRLFESFEEDGHIYIIMEVSRHVPAKSMSSGCVCMRVFMLRDRAEKAKKREGL